MSTCVDKTSAYKSNISERVKFDKISQGIQKANVLDENIPSMGLALLFKLQAARLEQPFDLRKALGMSGCQYHLKVREALLHRSKSLQKNFLLTTMRTPRDQQTLSIGFPFQMKRFHSRGVMRGMISPPRKLQITGDEDFCRICPNPHRAVGIFVALHSHSGKLSQHAAKK